MVTLYTIGHSTRMLDEFISILHSHAIGLLVDIRSYPASRRMPWFQGPQLPPFMTEEAARRCEALETTLPRAGIDYVWMRALGGRRRKLRNDSPNTAWHSPAFRNYADYMMTQDFRCAITELIHLAERNRTCVMCAEAQVYYHCHRMLLSDYLVAHGHDVRHIACKDEAKSHRLTPEARLEGEHLVYPAYPLLFDPH